MATRRKLPVGVQSFEDIRQNQYLYVDKTALMYSLVQLSTPYFLSRPRRFGKSLLLSAMEAYFKGRKELFAGLAIEKLETKWDEHPVLMLALNGEDYTVGVEGLAAALNAQLGLWEDKYGKDEREDSYAQRFAGIIRRACEKTGKKVVVLIDEYDKPMLDVIDNRTLYEANLATMRGFYGVLKRMADYLRFSFLTGITRIANLSVFSELNQLSDISMYTRYSTICGITQEEMETIFMPEIEDFARVKNKTVEEILILLKQNYNGYRFSEDGQSVYNPFSLLKAFDGQKFSAYWFATGTPTFLVKRVQQANFELPKLEDNVIVTQQAMSDYRVDKPDPTPLLYQSGYLTIKDYDDDIRAYVLGFPNDEVRYGFLNELLQMYAPVKEVGEFYVGFFNKDLRAGNVDAFMTRLRAYYASISYQLNNKTEKDFQTIFYLLLKLMGQFADTEVCSAIGRSDIEVHTKDAIYIFELKMTANGNADDALKQIQSRGYATQYAASGKRIVGVGIEFDESMRTVKDWKPKTIE